jgi:hypothetical protein
VDQIISRDARVDQIGFVDELETHHAEKLRGLVKGRMLENDIRNVEADFFVGLLVPGGLQTSVPPARLLEMWEAGEIDRQQFLSALTVRNDPLKTFLSLDAIDEIANKTKTPPKLYVKRKANADVQLVDAVRRLADQIK